MKSISIFFRFYGRTDNEIKQCLEELKSNGLTKFLRHNIRDAKLSCNIFIPSEYKPIRELLLYFSTLNEAKKVHSNAVLGNIYHKWATKIPSKTTFELRKPGDVAFGI